MAKFGTESRLSQPNLARHATQPDDSPEFRYAAPLLLEARRTYERFQAYCSKTGMPDEDEWQNVETVFAVAEMLQQAKPEPIVLDGQVYQVEIIMQQIQTWIWKTYQQLPSPSLRRSDQQHIDSVPYSTLADIIVEQHQQRAIAVVTTNYDVVFEYFMDKAGLQAHYPVNWSYTFGPGTEFTQWVARGVTPGLGPCVCKLHGSINYFEDVDARGNDVGRLFVAADYGGTASIGNSNRAGTFANEPAVLAMDALWTIQQKYGKGFVPAIIPPSYAKLRDRYWLRETWRKAFALLTRAERIIFIGYSLPRSDGFLRALLTGAAAERAGRKPWDIYVVDISPETHGRYRAEFGDLVRSWEAQAFSDALAGCLGRLLTEG